MRNNGRMDRIYSNIIKNHLDENRQMIFLDGARQVGKTTCCKSIQKWHSEFYYLNWDNSEDRKVIMRGTSSLAAYVNLNTPKASLPMIVLDKIQSELSDLNKSERKMNILKLNNRGNYEKRREVSNP